MRLNLQKSRKALLLSLRRFNHHVSAQKQPIGLNAIVHQTRDASSAATNPSGTNLMPQLCVRKTDDL